MNDIEDLVAVLRSMPDGEQVRHLGTSVEDLYSPLYYVVQLLRRLRLEKASYRVAQRNRPGRRWLDSVVERAREPVEHVFGSGPEIPQGHPERVHVLEDWLLEEEGDIYPPIILTRVVARAIEEVSAPTFWEQLRQYYSVGEMGSGHITRPLRPGDPVPVCDTVFAGRASKRGDYGSNPRNLPRWREPDRLGRVLLAPAGIDEFSVTLDFGFDAALELLLPSKLVATVHPTGSLDEYSWKDDGKRFWDVRPRDEADDPPGRAGAEHLGHLQSGIDAALEADAALIVLPELALTKEQAANVIAHWRAGQAARHAERVQAGTAEYDTPGILIAGSFHEKRGEESWRNVATIAARDVERTVEKSVPYAHTDAAATDGDLVEDIPQRRHPHVTIFCSERMTMAVFICVDFLLDSMRDLVRDLDVSLVVLPSMTGKSKVFRGLVAGHVAASQGTVVLANAVQSSDDASRGLIGHTSQPDLVVPLSAEHVVGYDDGPGVAVVDLSRDVEPRWISMVAGS